MRVPDRMPRIATDELWSPLFAEARIEQATEPGALEKALGVMAREEQAQVCRDRASTVTMPLAVPPPWVATLTVTVPAGCVAATFSDGEVTLVAPGTTFLAQARMGKTVVWKNQSVVPPIDPAAAQRWGINGPAEDNIVHFEHGRVRHYADTWLLGDALPWTRGEEDTGDFADFIASTGIPLDEIARRTATGNYAGAAIQAYQPFRPESGPAPPRRAALLAALEGIDPAQLTDPQRVQLLWLRRELAGWPVQAPTAGKATLAVDPGTLELEVNGKVVVTRKMSEQTPALAKRTATPTTVTVDVPAGEAVYVRTMHVSFAASDGGHWMPSPDAGWTAFLPGHTYEVREGRVVPVAPSGTTCVRGERGAEVARPEWLAQTRVQPGEAGLYTIERDAIGVTRVRFEAGACRE